MGDCKWVDLTGTCMEPSAISAIIVAQGNPEGPGHLYFAIQTVEIIAVKDFGSDHAQN